MVSSKIYYYSLLENTNPTIKKCTKTGILKLKNMRKRIIIWELGDEMGPFLKNHTRNMIQKLSPKSPNEKRISRKILCARSGVLFVKYCAFFPSTKRGNWFLNCSNP
jgi:hypothetical protein